MMKRIGLHRVNPRIEVVRVRWKSESVGSKKNPDPKSVMDHIVPFITRIKLLSLLLPYREFHNRLFPLHIHHHPQGWLLHTRKFSGKHFLCRCQGHLPGLYVSLLRCYRGHHRNYPLSHSRHNMQNASNNCKIFLPCSPNSGYGLTRKSYSRRYP